MERFAGGDDAAFTDVYAGCAPEIRRWLSRLTREPALAEDLAQETLLRMYAARKRWRPGARVMPWARAIARRLFLDGLRRGRAEEPVHALFTEISAAGSGGRADVELAARRMAEVVSATVAQLPPGQRATFRLVGEQGLSLSEACAALGDTNLSVRLRMYRARRAIEAALAEH
jgi:RNA polymerase sigma-70 factor (ECF subfamily)